MSPTPSLELIVYRLDELKRGQEDHRDEIAKLRDELHSLREEVASLKVKSGMWGAAAGAVPAAVAAVWVFLKG